MTMQLASSCSSSQCTQCNGHAPMQCTSSLHLQRASVYCVYVEFLLTTYTVQATLCQPDLLAQCNGHAPMQCTSSLHLQRASVYCVYVEFLLTSYTVGLASHMCKQTHTHTHSCKLCWERHPSTLDLKPLIPHHHHHHHHHHQPSLMSLAA